VGNLGSVGDSIAFLEGVHAGYGKKAVLQDVHLRIAPGDTVGLVGANGAGKTTLLQTIAGRIPPVRPGVIRLFGRDARGLSSRALVRLGMAYVPQGAHVFPSLTVTECVTTACRAGGVDSAEGISFTFEMFPRLSQRATQRASSLSGGERQMLAVSMALVRRPQLLLLDEPSIGLAPNLVTEIISRVIQFRQDHGTAVLIAEQNIKSILPLVETLYVARSGTLSGPTPADPHMSDEEMISALL
jgi:ABC-type branched-subunit amino acid transport system ATPase component